MEVWSAARFVPPGGCVLYSIGHSNLSVEEFLRLAEPLEGIIDVRTFPGSRRFPHFGREYMPGWLAGAGIGYVWCPALGGRRSRSSRKGEGHERGDPEREGREGPPAGRAAGVEKGGEAGETKSLWGTPGFGAYAWAMATDAWLTAADKLLAVAAAPDSHRRAVMCAEALWWRCHRSLIADYVVWRGLEVWHLQPKPVRHSEVIGDRLDRYPREVIQAWERWATHASRL